MLAAAFAVAKALSNVEDGPLEPANIRLGPDGALHAWLVAGPFPNVPQDDRTWSGMNTDWIGEANARPTEGGYLRFLRDPHVPDFWRVATTDGSGRMDFGSIFDGREAGVAYEYAIVHSDKAQLATMSIDGVRSIRVVWNGRVVHEGGPAKIKLALAKGANRLLVKTVHDVGPWNASLKLVAAGNVYETLYVYRTGSHAEPPDLRAIRAVRAKSGALGLSEATVYDSTARFASQWVERFRDVAYRPSVLENVIAEASRFVTLAQTENADRVTAALHRATDLIRAALKRSREKVLLAAQNPSPLLRANTAHEDFIRVAKGNRFFCHANGRPFAVLGFTQPLSGAEVFAANPESSGYDPEVTDAYFGRLADAGVNVLRLSINLRVAHGSDLSTMVSPERMKWIDTLVLLAYKHGVKLLISAYDSPRDNALTNGAKLIETSVGIAAQKALWKIIVDRWGNSGVVFGWEILNEGNLWKAQPKAIDNCVSEIASYIRNYEKSRWGRAHLVTSSTYLGLPSGLAKEHLDFAESHLYLGASRAPLDAWSPALDTISAAAACLGQTQDRLPFLDGENGPLDHPVGDVDADSEIFDHVAWSEFIGGAAGAGLRRPYREPDSPTPGMLDTISSLRRFSLGVDWSLLSSKETQSIGLKLPRRWIANGFATKKEATLWTAGPVTTRAIGLVGNGFPAKGHYVAYDCAAKKWLSRGIYDHALSVPNGVRSIAFVLTP